MLVVGSYKMQKNLNVRTTQIAHSMRMRASTIVKVRKSCLLCEPIIFRLKFSPRSQEDRSLVTSFETSNHAPIFRPRLFQRNLEGPA